MNTFTLEQLDNERNIEAWNKVAHKIDCKMLNISIPGSNLKPVKWFTLDTNNNKTLINQAVKLVLNNI